MLMTRNYQDITPCPACGNSLFYKRFMKQDRHFWKCRECGLEKQHPLPTQEELAHYYDLSYSDGMYKAHTDADKMKQLTARYRYNICRTFCRPGRWLDVGCSNGVFIEHLAKQGIQAEGIDISEIAIQDALKRGLSAYAMTVEQFQPEYPFDTITGFDILEHVLDPQQFLTRLHDLLVPEGIIVLCTPNIRSLSQIIMGRRWYFYIPQEHLHYFDPRSIDQILRRTGFEPIICRSIAKPLTFDYSLIQFKEYNPLVYRLLNTLGYLVPHRMREAIVPLYIGEMVTIAKCIK